MPAPRRTCGYEEGASGVILSSRHRRLASGRKEGNLVPPCRSERRRRSPATLHQARFVERAVAMGISPQGGLSEPLYVARGILKGNRNAAQTSASAELGQRRSDIGDRRSKCDVPQPVSTAMAAPRRQSSRARWPRCISVRHSSCLAFSNLQKPAISPPRGVSGKRRFAVITALPLPLLVRPAGGGTRYPRFLRGTMRSSSRRFLPDRPVARRSEARPAAGPENARSHAQGRTLSMASTDRGPTL
jgi:hypothetical protein